jgi:hypothetical protein
VNGLRTTDYGEGSIGTEKKEWICAVGEVQMLQIRERKRAGEQESRDPRSESSCNLLESEEVGELERDEWIEWLCWQMRVQDQRTKYITVPSFVVVLFSSKLGPLTGISHSKYKYCTENR